MSSVRSIEWYDGQHPIECEHCRCYHALRQVDTEDGAPIQFEVDGLVST